MDLVQVECTKLLANALNTACTSCFTVGILTPIAGYIYNVGVLGWLMAAVVLHWSARYGLGILRQ